MTIKFLWYVSSFFTIFLVLINSPSTSSGGGNSASQIRLLNIRSSQLSTQRLIVLTALMFLVFSIVLVVKI